MSAIPNLVIPYQDTISATYKEGDTVYYKEPCEVDKTFKFKSIHPKNDNYVVLTKGDEEHNCHCRSIVHARNYYKGDTCLWKKYNEKCTVISVERGVVELVLWEGENQGRIFKSHVSWLVHLEDLRKAQNRPPVSTSTP